MAKIKILGPKPNFLAEQVLKSKIQEYKSLQYSDNRTPTTNFFSKIWRIDLVQSELVRK